MVRVSRAKIKSQFQIGEIGAADRSRPAKFVALFERVAEEGASAATAMTAGNISWIEATWQAL